MINCLLLTSEFFLCLEGVGNYNLQYDVYEDFLALIKKKNKEIFCSLYVKSLEAGYIDLKELQHASGMN